MLHAWLIAFSLTCGADAATTHVGVSNGSVRETWLPTQNVYVIDAAVAGTTVAFDRSMLQMSKEHPKLALGLTIGMTALRGAIVASNLHQMRMAGRR